MKPLTRSMFLCALCIAFAAAAAADVIHLKNGKIEGTIIGRANGRVQIRTTSGIVTTVDEKDVEAVEKRQTPQGIYRDMAAKLDSKDADAHYALAMWCHDHGLKDEMNAELVATLKANPEHALARKELGHVKTAQGWMTLDEARRAKGMVRVDGRWMTKEEAEQHTQTAEQRKLARAIDAAANKIRISTKSIAKQWEEKLGALDKPLMAPKMHRLLKDRHAGVRRAAATALGNMRANNAAAAVVQVAVRDDVESVRDAARTAALKLDPERVTDVLHQAISGLKVTQIQSLAQQRTVKQLYHRIAVLLGRVGDVRSVPFLIAILYPKVEIVAVATGLPPITVHRPGGNDVPVGVTPGQTTTIIGTGDPSGRSVDRFYFNQAAEDVLKKLTGQNLGVLPKNWQRWWGEHGAELVRKREAELRSKGDKADKLLDDIEEERGKRGED